MLLHNKLEMDKGLSCHQVAQLACNWRCQHPSHMLTRYAQPLEAATESL